MKQPPPMRNPLVGSPSAFQRAAQWHQAGQFDQADALYRIVLAAQPGHFDAAHQLGVLRFQQGRYAEALNFFDAALRARPKDVIALSNFGLVNALLGRMAEALASYDKALAIKPHHVDALTNRGNALMDAKLYSEALASYDKALMYQPNLPEALNNRGNALIQLKRVAEAVGSYDKAIILRSNYVEAHNNRGNALRTLGRPEEALASFDRTLALTPDYVDGHNNRGNVLSDLSRHVEALASYDRALALRPDNFDALSNRSVQLRALNRAAEALASCDRALALKPWHIEAHVNRGNALRDLKRPVEALASYDQALNLNPDYATAHNNRANVLRDLKRPESALASCETALALEPGYVEALNTRGGALADLKRPAEALASYDAAIAIAPSYATAHDNKGVLLAELGRLTEAKEVFESAIKLAPKRTRAYYNMSIITRLTPDSPHLRAMEELAQNMSALSVDEQIDLDFALGKALADIGERESSFRRLLHGNALKRRHMFYHEAAALAVFERIRTTFTGDLMRSHAGGGDASRAPVFILGMPRSGTTLIEQILAGHPGVFAAGEIDDFNNAVTTLYGDAGECPRYPEFVAAASRERLRDLGADYVARIGAAASGAKRITNKTPENYLFAGLIHLALPNARIIYARRDPLDTCFSCFSQLFVEDLPYAYDLGELGRHCRAYEALMAHWGAVIPQSAMLEVAYENVVADLEGQARRIVAHCGLEWDANCLDFHQAGRQVRTASVAQVRQPIYQSSIGRWRAYEPFLGPLLAALRGE
jgi:tetratricopeptide (TPR) repeat protein